jgi:hypothetical protein
MSTSLLALRRSSTQGVEVSDDRLQLKLVGLRPIFPLSAADINSGRNM